jgi:hypothetical protein
MPDLTPELIKQTRKECRISIFPDGTLHLVFKDNGSEALGYKWVVEEACRRTLERTESRKP